MARWNGHWPPDDRLLRHVDSIIDRSPHADWLTALQATREADRLIAGIEEMGWRIIRACGDETGRCLHVGPHSGPHRV